jgi:hypothetical protein
MKTSGKTTVTLFAILAFGVAALPAHPAERTAAAAAVGPWV